MKDNLYVAENNAQEDSDVAPMPPADARLKQFFLEEARMFCPATRVNCSEYSKLHALYKRLQRTVRFLQLLYDHNWSEAVPDLQKACGFYVIEGYSSKKERLRLVELLAKEMNFITKAAQFNDFVSILLEYFTDQVNEIERILQIYYPPEKINWQPTLP